MISFHRSASKHGIDELSVLTALTSTIYTADLDDDTPARQLRLGFDGAGRLLEIVVLRFDSGSELVIYAMKARAHYRSLLD